MLHETVSVSGRTRLWSIDDTMNSVDRDDN